MANKQLNMSPGKLGAMIAHGVEEYFFNWFRNNVDRKNCIVDNDEVGYCIKKSAKFDRDVFDNWILGRSTQIILEASQSQMKEIVRKAKENGLVRGKDFFNIIDESTEFNDVPSWAIIAFHPLENEKIDPITGCLALYGHENSNLGGKMVKDEEKENNSSKRENDFHNYIKSRRLDWGIF